MFEVCIRDAFNIMLKETFKEMLLTVPVYSMYTIPKSEYAVEVRVTRDVKFDRWVTNRFNIEGINSDIFGYYEGFTGGRNSNKAVYARSQLGTILDYAVPGGFLITDNKKAIPLRVTGEDSEIDNPLQNLVQADLGQKKSKLSSILKNLPEHTKYDNKYEFRERPIIAVIPRQGRTIVGVVFLSYYPRGKGMRGALFRTEEGEFEVGVPFGGNFENAYHLIKYIQDLTIIYKESTPKTAEIPPVQDFTGYALGSIFEYLALEIARQEYSPDSQPFDLGDFLTVQGSVLELEKRINTEFEDIKMVKWGVSQLQ
jgi:hypothetical protein